VTRREERTDRSLVALQIQDGQSQRIYTCQAHRIPKFVASSLTMVTHARKTKKNVHISTCHQERIRSPTFPGPRVKGQGQEQARHRVRVKGEVEAETETSPRAEKGQSRGRSRKDPGGPAHEHRVDKAPRVRRGAEDPRGEATLLDDGMILRTRNSTRTKTKAKVKDSITQCASITQKVNATKATIVRSFIRRRRQRPSMPKRANAPRAAAVAPIRTNDGQGPGRPRNRCRDLGTPHNVNIAIVATMSVT
jgi:hypothetical protein